MQGIYPSEMRPFYVVLDENVKDEGQGRSVRKEEEMEVGRDELNPDRDVEAEKKQVEEVDKEEGYVA